MSVIVKGPSLLGANLGFVMWCFRFLALSQTLSFLANRVNFPWKQDFITCHVMSWAVRASSQAVVRDLRWSSTAGRWELEMTVERGWGLKPIMRKNGDLPVTEWGW